MAGRKSRRFKQLSLSMCFFKLRGGGLPSIELFFTLSKQFVAQLVRAYAPLPPSVLKKLLYTSLMYSFFLLFSTHL
jgi:hypothetical protein